MLACSVAVGLATTACSAAQDVPPVILSEQAAPGLRASMEVLSVRDADLRDVLRGMAEAYGVSIVVDNALQERVTLSLTGVTVGDALRYLARQYALRVEQTGNLLRVYRDRPAPAARAEPAVTVEDDSLLTVDFQGVPVAEAARLFTERTGRTVVVPQGLAGMLTAYVRRVPVREAIETTFATGGFIVVPRGRVLAVVAAPRAGEAGGSAGAPTMAPAYFGVAVSPDSLVSVDVQGVPATALLVDLARKYGLNLVTLAPADHPVTARVAGLRAEEAIDLFLQGSPLAFSLEGRTLRIGRRDDPALTGTRMLRMNFLRAEQVLALLPPSLKQAGEVQVVPEHNALLVRGSGATIESVARFLAAVDQRAPLVLVEALVVDFDDTVGRTLGLQYGVGAGADSLQGYGLGAEGFSGRYGAEAANRALRTGADLLGIRTIGVLPVDFYVRLQALEALGKARVLSRPQISTLSGQAATISVGTTQYYILRSTTPIGGGTQGGYIPYETQRFEKVEANVRLEVTPWVSATGEVMAKIKPEFSTPVGRFSSEVPPTINTRQLEANVRLHDGETIVLGGLIQESDVVQRSGIPLLGRLPIIGPLFRTSTVAKRRSELVIYLTPHVFYGDERDAERWREHRERLRLTDPDERLGRPPLRSAAPPPVEPPVPSSDPSVSGNDPSAPGSSPSAPGNR